MNIQGIKMKKPKAVLVTKRNLFSLSKLEPDAIIHAHKFVTKDRKPPCRPWARPKLRYRNGATVIERNYNPSQDDTCGAGLNVATKGWCLREWHIANYAWRRSDLTLLLVEFKRSDIVSIPTRSDGKFRVKRLKVLRAVKW